MFWPINRISCLRKGKRRSKSCDTVSPLDTLLRQASKAQRAPHHKRASIDDLILVLLAALYVLFIVAALIFTIDVLFDPWDLRCQILDTNVNC